MTIIKTTELYTLKGWILWCVDVLIKLQKKKKMFKSHWNHKVLGVSR